MINNNQQNSTILINQHAQQPEAIRQLKHCQVHLDSGVSSPPTSNEPMSTLAGALSSPGWLPPAYTMYWPGSITSA